MTKNQQLGEKVRIIYRIYCGQNSKRLLELFTNEKKLKDSYNYTQSRRRVINRYISGDNVDIKHIRQEFNNFHISRLNMDNEPLFTLDEFIQSDILSFTDRVKEYVLYEQKATNKYEQNYKYLYLYDCEVTCYTIEYGEFKLLPNSESSFGIKVIPPTNSKNKSIYKGNIDFFEKMISITLYNKYDHVTMLFDTSLKLLSQNSVYNNILYGVGIGINSKNQKIPVAKKVVLTESMMDEDEIKRHYLILNETQLIEADENLYNFDGWRLDINYLVRYKKIINNLHGFFSKLKYSEVIETSLVHRMIFTEFHAFSKMFEKFVDKKEFFLPSRKRVFLEFLRFLSYQKDDTVYLVMPLLDNGENIFLYESFEKESIKTLIKKQANEGIKFNIIIVINSIQNLHKNKFEKVFNELDLENIKLRFINEKDLDKSALGWDYFFTDCRKYVIAKDHMLENKNFTIIQDKSLIRKYVENYQKIEKLSKKYTDLKLIIDNPILKKLVGKWHCYFYGSFLIQKDEHIFWDAKLDINHSFGVKMISKEGSEDTGTIVIDENQSLIKVKNLETKNSIYMILNNRIIKDINVIKIASKQFQKDLDFFSIGIISKEKLTTKDAKKLLGETDKLLLKVDKGLQDRLDNFIVKMKYPK